MKSDASKTSHYTGPINVMTLREVSAYLHVHPSTIYWMLKQHQLPAFQVGSDWRFNVETIDRSRLGNLCTGRYATTAWHESDDD